MLQAGLFFQLPQHDDFDAAVFFAVLPRWNCRQPAGYRHNLHIGIRRDPIASDQGNNAKPKARGRLTVPSYLYTLMNKQSGDCPYALQC